MSSELWLTVVTGIVIATIGNLVYEAVFRTVRQVRGKDEGIGFAINFLFFILGAAASWIINILTMH